MIENDDNRFTFDFACYASIWYENGDEKTKRAILACLGSNLTISDKKLKLSYTSYFLSLIKARDAIEREIEQARTYKKPMLTKQNRLSVPVLSLGLRIVNEITTYFRTTKEYHYIPNLKDGIYELTRPTREQLAKV